MEFASDPTCWDKGGAVSGTAQGGGCAEARSKVGFSAGMTRRSRQTARPKKSGQTSPRVRPYVL